MVTPPTNTTIADRVRAAMDRAGVSEIALAEATTIPRTTLRRRLSGRTDWLTGELVAICEPLGVSLVDLLADEVAA